MAQDMTEFRESMGKLTLGTVSAAAIFGEAFAKFSLVERWLCIVLGTDDLAVNRVVFVLEAVVKIMGMGQIQRVRVLELELVRWGVHGMVGKIKVFRVNISVVVVHQTHAEPSLLMRMIHSRH
ncbi:hypothetical protein Ae201684_007384 [Aphanomyces euteiches]|uniref:Uncharacterized protein n=1 Tax=Aphanomyces euteiches TaxID=100861 RepID=A0A6G0X906_9STRA|nr:hypothetical protein Ae201684_007384 [Aphanomyces euteiches]